MAGKWFFAGKVKQSLYLCSSRLRPLPVFETENLKLEPFAFPLPFNSFNSNHAVCRSGLSLLFNFCQNMNLLTTPSVTGQLGSFPVVRACERAHGGDDEG